MNTSLLAAAGGGLLVGAACAAVAAVMGAPGWAATATAASLGALTVQAVVARRDQRRAERLAALGDSVLRAAQSGKVSSFVGATAGDSVPLERALDDAFAAATRHMDELRGDRARLQAVLSGMSEGVIVVNAAEQVELINEAARHMLDLQPYRRGRRYLEIVRHPDVVAQLGRALHGETPAGLELSIGDPGHILIAQAAPVVAGGKGGAVLVLHDITGLRRADRMRRDFVANVSHELRTPLTAIRGYVEALMDEPLDPEQSERFLEIIAKHSRRMESLVKDLLRLARLDAGQEVLEIANCGVEQIFAGVLAELSTLIDARHQQARLEIAPDASNVPGDAAKLHDVFRNLVENASSYSPEGSQITLGASGTDQYVELRVADEGPGVPEADRHRIFERFYRVDKARSRETGGTGLGLSIVRHLVELHGGETIVGSNNGRGAVFTVRLPRQPRVPTAPAIE